MRDAGSEYQQEESRLRGARPRVKAVLSPFDLDYGLAAGSGEFVHTAYGGEPGKLVLEPGYYTLGSWTSPVMQTFSPYLDGVVPAWEDQAGYMETRVSLRGAAEVAQVTAAPYAPMSQGEEYSLSPYFQVMVEFEEEFRAWAVDSAGEADQFTAYAVNQAPDGGYESGAVEGEFSGYLANLRLEGRLTLPEGEILDPGEVRVELARDFSALRSGDHVLVLDNRQGQWLPGRGSSFFLGLPWEHKELALYHGWTLPGGRVDWQLVYRGVLTRLEGMAHGWGEGHRVRLECRDWVSARLRLALGAPTPTGERRPFMRGAYLAQAELQDTTPVQVSAPVKSGSGSATLQLLGTYRGEYVQDYLLEIESSGEVGEARFRWSSNQGQSWQETWVLSGGAAAPVNLEEGLALYWEPGAGTDLVAGDRWTFTAQPPIYHYQVYGGPFEGITAVYLNGEETQDRVQADPASGVILVTGRSAQVEARVVKDATTHPVDIISDILGEMGLSQAIHQDSFTLAKSQTAGYAVGVCFENVPAAQAIREMVQRCLYDLWVDFGEIKMRAYLGEG